MQTYLVMRRFFHRGEMQKVGTVIKLAPADGSRYGYLGYVEGPLKQPKRSRKRVKNGSDTD